MTIPKTHRRVVLVRRPPGEPAESDFRVEEVPVPEPRHGEVLVKVHYLSLDPYQRGRMRDAASYASPVGLGEVMTGGTVGEVVASQHPDFKVGDIVEDRLGWQEYAIGGGPALRKVDPSLAPISTANGVLGMPGMTAYFGLLHVGQPKPGETVVVSAASGAVGQVVGQIARIMGCRTVGIAGGAKKCAFVKDELGFDACIDYKAEKDLDAALRAACPNGPDVYFDNVGGEILDAVLERMNEDGRVAICGLISEYNTEPRGIRVRAVLDKSLTITGFRIGQRLDRRDHALGELFRWWRDGKLHYRETVAEGIEAAPAALINMLRGGNYGKQVVRLAAAPPR